MGLVWVCLVHLCSFKPPHRSSRHNPQAKRPGSRKVYDRVCLLHKPLDFTLFFDIEEGGQWFQDNTHTELSEKSEKNGIVKHKVEIINTFSVLVSSLNMIRWNHTSSKKPMNCAFRARESVGPHSHQQHNQWLNPSLSVNQFSVSNNKFFQDLTVSCGFLGQLCHSVCGFLALSVCGVHGTETRRSITNVDFTNGGTSSSLGLLGR